jgi:hypothetical protein
MAAISLSYYACILKAHSKSGGSIRASLAGVSVLFLNSWRVSVLPYYGTTHPPAIQKRYNTDTQGKLRLNLHSLSVSELLEYRISQELLMTNVNGYEFIHYTHLFDNGIRNLFFSQVSLNKQERVQVTSSSVQYLVW